ncbi:MAG TPA: ABC transporter ATP-binding protein [Thermoanaerobaculia bacterium]|nr:ABC transporter ATP-binding protein [Thermoanaerobaculia bacterium]
MKAVPTTIAAENLSKAFSGAPLFSGLSFSASRGLVAIAGRNGSGKTTLLKILAGLARPTSGRVRVETDAAPSASARRLAVGWAGPDLQLYGALTAVENLAFFRRAAGRPAGDAELTRRLRDVGLAEGAIHRRVEEYSTGMKQRLRVAFAVLFDPPVLILDEPMVGLDVEGRDTVDRVVAAARERGPVLLASNDERDFARPDQRVDLTPAGARA